MTVGNDGFGPVPPRPKDWNDVFAITGGLKGISIKLIEQGRLDWRYDFDSSDMRPCGREGCETDHSHGWIVALSDGRYVHIGIDCARKYAQAELWEARESSYKARVKADAAAKAIAEARELAQQKQDWLKSMPEIDRLIALHESFTREAGGSLLREIERRAERGESRIEVEVKLSKEQREARQVMALGGRVDASPDIHVSGVETAHVGDIAGLACFRVERNLRDSRARLQRRVTTLLTWTPREDDKDAIRSIMQATRELAPDSNALNESIVAARNFFTKENLATLMKLEKVIKAQGIVSIELDGQDRVRITRLPHWNRAA